jgi:hypothetical protein
MPGGATELPEGDGRLARCGLMSKPYSGKSTSVVNLAGALCFEECCISKQKYKSKYPHYMLHTNYIHILSASLFETECVIFIHTYIHILQLKSQLVL